VNDVNLSGLEAVEALPSYAVRLTSAQMARMSRLLDEALLLDEAGRCHWLDALDPEYEDVAEALREALLPVSAGALLALATLPKFRDDPSVDGSSRLQAGARVGPYELIKPLGEGGMGQVWLAEQIAPVRRPVALKLIKAGMYDATVVQRFQAERQSLAIMDHPAIAKVFDAGITPQGQPYLVMEYVPGVTITEYCDQKKLKIRERLELFIQACEGVQHAHQKAIIHRDLKPANILVIEVDGKPTPRIIDFGLAKATTSPVADRTQYTQLGQFIGTPGYMSPERVDPNIRDIDTRTDVYSLGVILYVLLTGLQPFETTQSGRPPLDVWLRQLREEDSPSMSAKVKAHRESTASNAAARSTDSKQLVYTLRGDLDCIAMKALQRDRERRYATPSDLSADLRRYLENQPVTARPASAMYQLRKFVQRHRIAAVVTIMLTILAIVASSAGVIAIRQKQEAQYQATRAVQAQVQLLTQAAVQRLRDSDAVGAQRIILEMLTNPEFPQGHTPTAISLFQQIRADDAQLAVLSGHDAIVLWAAYSPDGARIVTAAVDKTARIWDARTGVELTVLAGHSELVRSGAYSPDGTRIVTASDDKTARIWDARTGAQLAVLSGHGDRVFSAAYSPDGTRIVTASDDRTARTWDARTGVQLAVLSGHGDRVDSAAYSPNGECIVTAAPGSSRPLTTRPPSGMRAQVRSSVNSPA
jgi:eukaryotic-like serine/threonine-protein kinase